MRRIFLLLAVCLPAAAGAGIHVTAGFCGMNRHMEFIDTYGRALELYRLGEFDIADKRIPLYAYWSSKDDATKSLLGCGWHVPWFECRMIPLDESSYELHSMFGERLRFRKDPKIAKLYRHGKLACATVSKDIVKVYIRSAPSSVPDMVFVGGRLAQFAYGSKTFGITYDKGYFSKMACGGRTVLSIERTSRDSRCIEIFFNGNKDNPALVRTGRASVCTGIKAGSPVMSERSTVVAMQTAKGESYEFSYGMKGDMGRMFDGRTEITWNPATRSIATHGDWVYDVSEHDPDRGVFRLRRRSSTGEENEYSYNARTGLQKKVFNGVRETSRLFTSGKLRGLIRWEESRGPGNVATRTECSYDNQKRLVYFKIIDLKENSYTEYWNNEDGRLERFRINGDDSTMLMYKYDSKGNRIAFRCADVPSTKEMSVK